MSPSKQGDGDDGLGGGLLVGAGVAYLLWLLSRPAPGPGESYNGFGRNMTEEEAAGLDVSRFLQNQFRVTQAPWVTKSGGSEPFMEMNAAAVTLPAVGSEVTVVSFTVPPRRCGVIEFFANQFVGGGWNEGSGDLVWRLEADGIPIQGYHNILASVGSMAAAAPLGNSVIDIYEGQTIRLVAQNVAVPAAGQNLLGLFRGRYYPIELEAGAAWL